MKPVPKPRGWKLWQACLCAALLVPGCAPAQGWQPERAIEIVAPVAPGGGIDRTARLVQKIIHDHGLAGVPVNVVNKPGGGGALSLAYLNQHAGDAHVVAIASPNLLINEINGRDRTGYREVTPLANLYSEYIAIAVRAESPLRTGQDLIDRLRRDPQSLALGVPSTIGSVNHLSFALLARAAGIDPRKLKPVPLGSGGNAVTMLLGGHVDAHAGASSSLARLVQEGRLRVIGVLAPGRSNGPYAGIPTWREQGYRAVMDTWRGVIGPRDMTTAQIAWWDGMLAKVVASSAWTEALRQNGGEANYLNSARMRTLLQNEYAEYRVILGELGLLK